MAEAALTTVVWRPLLVVSEDVLDDLTTDAESGARRDGGAEPATEEPFHPPSALRLGVLRLLVTRLGWLVAGWGCRWWIVSVRGGGGA